jgi:hypothetical protein
MGTNSFLRQSTYLVLHKALPCPLSLAKRVNPIPLPQRETRWFVNCHWLSLILEGEEGSGGGDDLRSNRKGGGGMFIQ